MSYRSSTPHRDRSLQYRIRLSRKRHRLICTYTPVRFCNRPNSRCHRLFYRRSYMRRRILRHVERCHRHSNLSCNLSFLVLWSYMNSHFLADNAPSNRRHRRRCRRRILRCRRVCHRHKPLHCKVFQALSKSSPDRRCLSYIRRYRFCCRRRNLRNLCRFCRCHRALRCVRSIYLYLRKTLLDMVGLNLDTSNRFRRGS